MKLVSAGENNFYFRVFVLVLGLIIIALLNFLFVSYFIGYKYGIWLVVFLLVLIFVFYILLKNFKYIYKIEDNNLIIKTSSRTYSIPLSDIKSISKLDKISMLNKIGLNFDIGTRNLYLCGFVNRGIILELETHNIVICPRKFDEFYNSLKLKIK